MTSERTAQPLRILVVKAHPHDFTHCAGTCGGDLEFDCAGVCGGDNSTALSCCGLPFYDDCTTDCYEDSMGTCCIEGDADECGLCFGDNACLGCSEPFIDLDGYCFVFKL